MHSITRKYNFINIVKKYRNFAQYFDKSKHLGVHLHPASPAPTPLSSCTTIWRAQLNSLQIIAKLIKFQVPNFLESSLYIMRSIQAPCLCITLATFQHLIREHSWSLFECYSWAHQ